MNHFLVGLATVLVLYFVPMIIGVLAMGGGKFKDIFSLDDEMWKFGVFICSLIVVGYAFISVIGYMVINLLGLS